MAEVLEALGVGDFLTDGKKLWEVFAFTDTHVLLEDADSLLIVPIAPERAVELELVRRAAPDVA